MDEKTLMQFVQWLPTRVKELADATPDEIVEVINQLGQSEEGVAQLQSLFQEFEKESKSMFKKGGKFDYIFMLRDGGCPSCEKKVRRAQKGKKVSSSEHGKIDSQKESTKEQSWIDELFGRNIPLIVVGSTWEGDPADTEARSIIDDKGRLKQIIKRNFTDHGGIDEITREITNPFTSLADTVYTREVLHPESWFSKKKIKPEDEVIKLFDRNFEKAK